MKRISKDITDPKDIEFILNIKEEDVTASFINETFGEFNGKSRFNPYDTITIPPGYYKKDGKPNKNSFVTTIGLWVFNKYFIENELSTILGYINEPITDDKYSSINTKLSYALLEDKISLSAIKKYLIKGQFFMQFTSVLAYNHSMDMLLCTTLINKKKNELYKQYKDEIDKGNEVVAEKMEKELLAYAKEILKDDPAMDMFESGARGSFKNNFKNMYVMKGAIKDPDPVKGGYNISLSNYMDGISKDEYATLAKSLAAGPYQRAKKTEVGGYWEKLFVSAFQHVKLLPAGSDCHTKRTITITLDKNNIKNMMYSYIVEGDKLIELTSDNIDKYLDKTVKMRFSSLCESKNGVCNKCAGNLFYRHGITNVGVATPVIPSKLKLFSMKAFHDSTVQTIEMDPMKAFGIKK